MKYLLSLDIGTNSIGWWAYELACQDGKIWKIARSLDGGIRLFSDGREPSSMGRVGDSLAVARRIARGMRRNRDRRSARMRQLIEKLIENNLLPKDKSVRDAYFVTANKKSGDPDQYNPYRLRAMAAETTLPPYELGRALQHLGRRRGYLSNRREASDEDGGKLKDRMTALEAALKGQTLGQYLWAKLQTERAKPARGKQDVKPGPIRFSEGSTFFPTRQMYEAEFERIKAQQQPHLALTDDDWRAIQSLILDQRPLKPVERGRCEYFTDKPRHWSDTPTGHFFRIYQETNNLKVIHRDLTEAPLSSAQYDAVLKALFTKKKPSFKGLRGLKDQAGNRLFPADSVFNLEGAKRKHLNGHKLFIDMQADPLLKTLWDQAYEDGMLDQIFIALFEADTEQDATQNLQESFGLDACTAHALAALKLSRATSSLSLEAMQQLVTIMRDQGLPYHDAVTELYDAEGNRLHHSQRAHNSFDRLPYYGAVMPEKMLGAKPEIDAAISPEKHFGRINNPTVHVALNQVRLLVNTLTDRFGSAPFKIHSEVTRALKKPKHAREEEEKQQKANEKRNSKIRDQLKAEFGFENPSANDLKKWKLWEELGGKSLERCCPFTGKAISANQLFNGEVEIEHILPFSRTLDNSLSNLTLAFKWANALKGNNTPFEAFHSDTHAGRGIVWSEILERINHLPRNKKWRFSENAMAKFDEDSGFIARQLTDTAYISKIAARYLKSLKGVEDVLTLPGGLTAMVRGKWHLNGLLSDDNKKSRDDHRHHAVDAAVIGLIDRSLLQGISRLTARGADDQIHIRIPDMPDDINAAIRQRVPNIMPSHRPDHSLEGKIYNETAYGFIETPVTPEEAGKVVTRKALTTMKTAKEIDKIRDPNIRGALQKLIAQNPTEKIEKIAADYGLQYGIKRVRILVPGGAIKPIQSAPYKGYQPGQFICCDIWKIPPKKLGGKATYEGQFWGYDEVTIGADGGLHLDKLAKKPHPAAKFITRLFKDDLLEIGLQNQGEIYRVSGFSTTNNRLSLVSPTEANPGQSFIGINVIGHKGLRRVHITADGRRVTRRAKSAPLSGAKFGAKAVIKASRE